MASRAGTRVQPFHHLHQLLLRNHVYVPASVVSLALAAALCYALASVLQQRAAARQPHHLAKRMGLLVRLVRQPLWLVGNLADGAGYVFQFLALRRGSLALVEPLMVAGLLFALPLGALLDHRRLTARQWAAGLTVVAGLAMFLIVSRPGPGRPHATAVQWTGLTVLVAAAALAALGLGRGSATRRALVLAAGAGVVYGYTSAVTERTGHLLNRGVVHAAGSWAPYALVVSGVIGMVLAQSAFQAGHLRLSLPLLTVVQPLVAIAIGRFVFGEHISSHGAAGVGEVLGIGLMIAGVFALAQTPGVAVDEVRAGPDHPLPAGDAVGAI